jgi:hypothetical protein
LITFELGAPGLLAVNGDDFPLIAWVFDLLEVFGYIALGRERHGRLGGDFASTL